MNTFTVYTGKPGAGKTLLLAKKARELLERNIKIHKKYDMKRQIASNIKFSDQFEEKYKGYITYWTDPRELPLKRDVDVIWDEVPSHLDATEWANMSLELKRWLQQHRKVGCEIYGTAQSFSQVDISARRLVTTLWWLQKVIGSPPPSATKPPVKRIWGVGIRRQVDPINFDEKEMEFIHPFPTFYWMGKNDTQIFDTAQVIEVGEYPPMKHIERKCELQGRGCNFHKVIHK